jgi:hypothetical protein
MPTTRRVVVDGSNLATEGRSVPSLAQLDEAVRAYLAEDPSAEVVVVVDASFSHRIDPSEVAQLEGAERHGEVVAPPAGAIGRGDAFILRIAERTGAVVLSNDSFQEFHDEHPWLFDEGRLVGGKPVPGVGWIFTPRRPVRGPRSRTRAAKTAEEVIEADEMSPPRKAAEVAKALEKAAKAKQRPKPAAKATAEKGVKKKAAEPTPVAEPAGRARGRTAQPALKAEAPKAAKAAKPASEKRAQSGQAASKVEKVQKKEKKPAEKVHQAEMAGKEAKKKEPSRAKRAEKRAPRPVALKTAIHQATEEVLAVPAAAAPRSDGKTTTGPKRRRRASPPSAVNEPLAFITFVAAHPLGSTLDGVVASFTSHGAMVDVPLEDNGVLHCYAPLTGLGKPPPRAAREVLRRGEERPFALVALDPPRRMAELALPELAPSLLGAGAGKAGSGTAGG